MFKTSIIKKTFFAVAIAAVTFSSCKKDDNETIPSPAKPLQLTEFSDGTDTTKFDYNPDGSLKTITLANDPVSFDDNVTYTVRYLANKKIDELNGSNGTKIKLSYTNGLVTKSEAFNGVSKFGETVFQYNGNVLKSAIISLVDNGISVPFFRSDLTINGAGNISRANSFVFNPLTNELESTGHAISQYDNKINPFANLRDVILVFWQEPSKNNITKQEYFKSNGAAEAVIQTVYTYNDKGYPTRATMTENEPGEPQTTAILTFKYK